jgi:DNA-binding transcriptional LysR family regulator
MRYSFRQLEVFLTAARLENLSRAAERLAMSQSAASAALRDLEDQFGIRLFDRIGKRLQLNELGRSLQPRAEALLEQARELERSFVRHEDLGRLKVGATLTIGNYLAVGLLARYMSEQPGARVSLEVGNTARIAAAVASFELDVGLIEGELNAPELDVTTWREDELVVFCAPDHPLARRRRLGDDDLRAATWIVREPGSGTRQAFDRAMHGLLPDLRILLELQHTEGIKRAVEEGLGLGCLSGITLADEFRLGSLVPLAVPHRDLTRRLYLILHREKYLSPGLKRWLALCRSYA